MHPAEFVVEIPHAQTSAKALDTTSESDNAVRNLVEVGVLGLGEAAQCIVASKFQSALPEKYANPTAWSDLQPDFGIL